MNQKKRYTRRFEELSSADANIVGGKNSALGELIRALKKKKINVPDGFAITADAYWRFVQENQLEEKIRKTTESSEAGPRRTV